MKGYRFVYLLKCRNCNSIVSHRAMKSVLLSNPKIKLFSTNSPSAVLLYNLTYVTRSCECVISNVKCKECKVLLGYTIVIPCALCLNDRHNGHLWMFDMCAVSSTIQVIDLKVLKWVSDTAVNDDSELKIR